MEKPFAVTVPLLNANEPEARLVQIHCRDAQPVQRGDLLFTIETTKAASDVEADVAGYVHIRATEGDTLSVGSLLAYITDSPEPPADDAVPQADSVLAPQVVLDASPSTAPVLSDLRITQPARQLAESMGLDLATLPRDRLVTEAVVRQLARPAAAPRLTNASIVLYGGGGHAKAVLEMILAIGAFRLAGVIDDNPALAGGQVLGVPVLGGREKLAELYDQGVGLAANGVGGIINIDVRVRLFELLMRHGYALPALRHPRATVEASARLGDGVQVFANAYVGSSTVLHDCCMVNTGAIVSHDCEIGRYTHIAPGAMLAGHVHVGERALVGMGVTTAIGIHLGDGVRIGNGAILLTDVPSRQIVPAGKVWNGDSAHSQSVK